MQTLPGRTVFTIILITSLVACGGGMGGRQDMVTGKTKLQGGIDLARNGISRYQAGTAAEGLGTIDQGRGMMGQGMVMMGLGCCIGDGSPAALDAGAADSCASSMGPGAPAMVQGLGKFDGARSMMGHSAAADAQAMADMEAAMGMMEQGSTDMMGSGGGAMPSGMM